MTTITEAQQKLEVGQCVHLFALDLTAMGGGVLYWSPSRPQTTSPIIWRGNTYTSVDVKAEGFEKSTSGTLPRPTLSVGNADNLVGALLRNYNDVLGAIVTRTRTLYEFLDDQPGADPDALWPVDIYRVERKISQTKNLVVLELAAATDNASASLPGRVALRDVCTLRYRRWNGSAFDYSNATCPYTGAACFNTLGVAVPDAQDSCGKRVSDCKKRFGAQAQLPYGGFPAMARIRANG